MAQLKSSFTLIVISLLLVIPLFCEAAVEHDTDTQDPGSGEAEIPQPRHRPGYGASPDEGEEEGNQVSVGQRQDPAASEEEAVQQSTPSSVAAVGSENNHLPREPDTAEREEEESEERDEEDSEEHETEESVELTTLVAAPSSAVPLAPIPPEEQDVDHQDSNSQQTELLNPEPSQTVIIWDGTGEPDRELSSNQPEQPTSQPEEKKASQPEEPASQPGHHVDQPEQPLNKSYESFNKPVLPLSQELHGGANGNGQPTETGSDGDDKSSSDKEVIQDRPGAKPVPVTASGSTSSAMAWVVVFAVVSSALLISGTSDSEADKDSWCYLGCRHNFNDFNPYAWPPTPANRKEITLRPVT